jgi:hypothetical protein
MRTESLPAADLTELADWVQARVPGDVDLDTVTLAQLVTDLAAEPRFWRHLVRHDPSSRYFFQLYRDPHLDLWLICWLDSQDTGYHDHDLSAGAVHVVEGRLHEDFFGRDQDGWIRERTNVHYAGDVFRFDSSYIHGVRHAGGPPATSLHAYSPALWRMGHYEPDDNGAVRRMPITYADELAAAQ